MIITVPIDVELYPTMGPQVCDWMLRNLVHGPGDLLGQPLTLDLERQGLIYRMYEVYPRTHPYAGRRRFSRVALSMAKGMAKTELAALVAAAELSPEAPVRCVGWTPGGEPIGGPVTDPYIPLVAYTEEQSDELCYNALRIILTHSLVRDDFNIDLARITRRKGEGKAVALSTNPSARDGARTTFMVLDETHLWLSPRHKRTYTVMYNNLPKRKLADPWGMETTTAFEPGRGSVAEDAMDYALALSQNRTTNTSFFFYHRQASNGHDITTDEGATAAVEEASGGAKEWRDIPKIVRMRQDPKMDLSDWERFYCNRIVKSGSQAFDVELWKALTSKEDSPVKPGDLITLGFDGAMFHDGTGLVATHIETGFQWVPGAWECPPGGDKRTPRWQVPTDEVDALVARLFEEFDVWRLYADPPYWQSWIAKWAGTIDKGRPDKDRRIVEWWTNRRTQMAAALENFHTAMMEATITHDGDPRLTRHIGNARRLDLPQRDEQERPLWLIQKDRPDSFHKIDNAMASVLSWEARTDAIAAGATKKKKPRVYFMGGEHAPTKS